MTTGNDDEHDGGLWRGRKDRIEAIREALAPLLPIKIPPWEHPAPLPMPVFTAAELDAHRKATRENWKRAQEQRDAWYAKVRQRPAEMLLDDGTRVIVP